ncbi:MAG: DUF2868 domain-containing protein [Verrucomicrobiales bacterium]|nr:DUF2868 domain-containing protein [Verrucomicrobiales bacterium]
MKTENTRKILALQAIEQADEKGVILSEADFREAGKTAGAPLSKKVDEAGENSFLATRAELLLIRATSRFPEAAKWATNPPAHHRMGLFAIVLLITAAALGFLTSELGPEKRINILSFPLLGILLWNLVIYLREIILLSKKRDQLFTGAAISPMVDFLQASLPLEASGDKDDARALAGAQMLFEKRWKKLLVPVTGARIKSILHTTAMVLALAAVGGMYVKGLANEYRAVWESTFFSESAQLRPFLSFVLGPAVSVTGDSIPSIEELDLIHWKAGEAATVGDNAARWIHWYAITIGLFVLIPRGLLAVFWRIRAARLARTLPFRDMSPGYYEHLLAVSTGNTLTVSVVPYPLSPDESVRKRIQRTLESHFEKPVGVNWIAAVAFGEEEESVPGLEGETIPLFDFSSTPEKETQLTLYQTLLEEAPNPVRFILLETTAFDQKTESLSDGNKRREARMTAWRNLFEAENVELLSVASPTSTRPSTTT